LFPWLFAAALFFAAGAPDVRAAPPRPWETLAGCSYVADKNNDGDSFRVRDADGNEFTARLYYVDTPECTLTYAERARLQGEYFGITLDETWKIGAKAKERTRELLREPFTVITRRANAGGRAKEPRHYVFVQIQTAGGGTRSLAETLVGEGLALVKGVTPNLPDGTKASAYVEQLKKLESAARKQRLGAWAVARAEAAPSET
jgi:endonuclease YncB( thermonuclease family)